MFTSLLQHMLGRIEGAEAAVIIGLDGIVIDSATQGRRTDLEMIAAEYTGLLRNSARTASDTGLGDLQELLVATEQVTLVIKFLNPSYFVLVALDPHANLGRARFELRKAQLTLAHEFAV